MKHKFLIENDVGLSLQKIDQLINDLQEIESFEDTLDNTEYVLREVLFHLQQALDNLVFEEDFDNV